MADIAAASVKEVEKKKPARENGVGIVKSVPAGDTLIIVQKLKDGPPKEHDITLTNIKAPRPARRTAQGYVPDEPFGFQSREFLRKKAVGKQVTFIVENRAPNSNKEFGYVYLLNAGKEPENLAVSIVSEGWAELRANSREGQLRPELEELLRHEEAARKEGKGIFRKDIAPESTIRPTPQNPSNTRLFESLKGAPVQGIVEQVIVGSTLRIQLLPSYNEIKLLLSGVECPSTGVRDEQPEPFAREAKFFTEHFLLNRDVQVVLEGADQNNFYGTVQYAGHNISEELLKNGLAKYVDWSGARTAFNDKLKAAERSAKEKKLRIWANWVEPAKLSRQEEKSKPKVGKEFIGRVVDIQNVVTIGVLDAQGAEIKVNLSSIRARGGPGGPRGKAEGRDEARDRAQQFEAKEFLRRKLIGQRVRCVLDYTRTSEPREGQAGRPAPAAAPADRGFYTVYLDKLNIAVALVENNYAEPVFHKPGEPRARDFEDILAAEAVAKRAAKKESDAALPHINDLSLEPAKSRQFLPFLKRAGRLRGVVEFEFSASRFKVFVPKESCLITLALAGIRTPRQGDEFSTESRKLVRELVHQHDVEFEVFSQDKGGNFIGHLWVGKKNVATALLEEGYASLQKASLADTGAGPEYLIAEETAKKGHKNIWKNYDEAAEEAKRLARAAERAEQLKPKTEIVDVIVTEVVDASLFYVQIVSPEAEQLEELMKVLSEQPAQGPFSPAVGEIVSAQFSEDDAWYRAKVTAVNGSEVDVFYVDYGNSEKLPTSRLRPLPANLPKLAFQAHEAQLAYIRAPKLSDDFGQEAVDYFRDLVWEKSVFADIKYREEGKLFLSLGDRESGVDINRAMLMAGFGRVEKFRGKHLKEILESLRESEDVARKNHLGLFTYGDPGSDEDEL